MPFFVVSYSIMNSNDLVNSNSNEIHSQSFDNVQDKLIEWRKDVKLNWSNFQGIPDTTSEYMAMTFTKIKSVPVYYDSDSIIYNIANSFNSIDSWSRDKNSSSLLKHEKLHFDISELVTRMVRKEYSETRIVDLETTYSKLSEIFKYYTVTIKDSINTLYDEQTEHGTVASKQQEWELMITKELKSLELYSSTRVTVRK